MKTFREKATADFADIEKIFKKYHIDFFALFGTALGAVREGNFIEYDTDIDLGIIEPICPELRSTLIYVLRAAGFTTSNGLFCPGKATILTRNTITGILPLVKFHKNYVLLTSSGRVYVSIPKKFLQKGWIGKLGNFFVNIPCYADIYLKATYGPTWQTPDPKRHATLVLEEPKNESL